MEHLEFEIESDDSGIGGKHFTAVAYADGMMYEVWQGETPHGIPTAWMRVSREFGPIGDGGEQTEFASFAHAVMAAEKHFQAAREWK